MSQKPLDTTDRLEQQYRRLGTREPVCVACSESDPFCLELHHIAANAHHKDLSIVCRNCHRKLTNRQHDHAKPPIESQRDVLNTIGQYLLGLCDLLALVITTLREFAGTLIARTGVSHE
jgi:hypothetical protein